jgi:hypothetical protein
MTIPDRSHKQSKSFLIFTSILMRELLWKLDQGHMSNLGIINKHVINNNGEWFTGDINVLKKVY